MQGALPFPENDDSTFIVIVKILIITLTIVMLVISAIGQTTAVLKRRGMKMGFQSTKS